MRYGIARTAVLVFTVIAVQAAAEDVPDLRAILSARKQRIFTARIVGVTVPPEPFMRMGGRGDAKLLKAVSYWLRVGKDYEAGAQQLIVDARRRTLVVRPGSLSDILFLKFENHPFGDTDLQTWTNIALATAAIGDYKPAAEIFDEIEYILDSHQPRLYNDSRSYYDDDITEMRVRSDANALWIQHAETQNDLEILLNIFDKAQSDANFIHLGSAERGRVQWYRGTYAAAFFNYGLILEKLGLHTSAMENYRRSIEQSDDERWNEEAVRRIDRISRPSRRERWLEARTRLGTASRDRKAREMRQIIRVFPEDARIAAEKELLAAWARGALVGSTVESTHQLRIARMIGAARRGSFGDTLLAETVAGIDQSIRKNDALRIDSLAKGFLLYERGGTAATFEEAALAFNAAESPMTNIARFRAIVTRFDTVHIDQSLEQLRELEHRVSTSHRALRATIDGAIGNCLAERGEFEAALETFSRARRVFEILGETDSAALLRASAAHMLTLLGDPEEAWRIRLPALRAADASGDPALVELVLRHMASDERFASKEFRAMALYRSVLPEPPVYARPGSPYRGSRWRNPVPLHSKQVMLDALGDRPLPADVQNDLRIAQAISLYQRMPEQAEALLSESIAFADATGRVAMLPHVYFYRAMARCETQRGRDLVSDPNAYENAVAPCDPKRVDDAIHDLNSAISLLEARRRKTVRQDLRDRWDRAADDLFRELMSIHWNRGDDNAVFVLGERQRGTIFLDGITAASGPAVPLTAERISERLEPDVAVIVFTASGSVVPRSPLATIIEKDRVAMHRLKAPTGNLYFLAKKLRIAIAEDRQSDIQSFAESFYETLIRPLGISNRIQRLVIVADDPLRDVPFAVLRDRDSGQYLIQRFELMFAASASAFAQTKGAALLPVKSVVAVGDPAFDRNTYPSLPSLPAARAEAVAIGRQYPQSRTLVGRKATFQNLAATVRTADVIHIAAHTARRSEREDLKLLLAPSRQQSGACTVAEMANLSLKEGSTVVLPGCQTGTSDGPGILGDFAGSFLVAGARNVVATLWDIEDDPSRSFALLFHRALRRCGSAVTATREAQLAMLRSSNESVRNPRAWSGFQVYGIGS
jgi:CHAT domain-containing protein/tetratricopeptide (TPR) repeat protein